MAMLKFRAAPLPKPPDQYSSEYVRQLIRVIELYFGQLDSKTPLQADYFKGRGDQLVLPHIAVSDTANQYAGGNDTPTAITFNTTDSDSGWTRTAPGTLTCTYPGVYTFRYSLQLVNTANAIHKATVWGQLNGSDITGSATLFSIPARKSAMVPAYICAYSEFTLEAAAQDEVVLYWATDQAYVVSPSTDGVYMLYEAAQTVPYAHPSVPSAIASITFTSAVS